MRHFRILAPANYDTEQVFKLVEDKLIGAYLRRNGITPRNAINASVDLTFLGACSESGKNAWEVEFEMSKHMERKIRRVAPKERTFFFHIGVTNTTPLSQMIELAERWISDLHRLTEDLIRSESLFNTEVFDYAMVLDEI